MTRPTARVLALLEILQSGGTHTVASLAERLGVDERTVRRYAGHLIDLEIPVRSERGRYGGYRLAPGYRMPPLMLTADEAVAVALGLVAGRTSGLIGSPAASQSASAKLRRVLPAPLAARLDELLGATHFTGPSRARPEPAPRPDVVLELGQAAARHRAVSIDYRSPDGRTTVRDLHPYGLLVRSGRWYVTGLDRHSAQVRTFRVDRVHAVRIGEQTFDVPAGFDTEEQVVTGIARAPRTHRVSVRVRTSAELARARLPATLAEVSGTRTAGWVRVRMNVESVDWVPAVLAGLEADFVVERPAALRDAVATLAERFAAAAHSKGDGSPAPTRVTTG